MKYKASCIKCKNIFGFINSDLKVDCEIEEHTIEMQAYVNCPKCGLKLTITRVEVNTICLEEYSENRNG